MRALRLPDFEARIDREQNRTVRRTLPNSPVGTRRNQRKSMSAPEHQTYQFDTGSPFEDTVYFDAATNLTGASVSFVYRDPEATESTVRSAVIASASPSAGAATSAVLRRNLVEADVDEATERARIYEWKITLASGALIIRPRPSDCVTDEFPNRSKPSWEVLPSLTQDGDDTDDPEASSRMTPLVVGTIDGFSDSLKSLPAPVNSNYRLLHVMSDENGQRADFEFDASIVADDIPNGEYVLTAGGGGFRRKGL